MQLFNKHYLFAFSFVFVIAFSFITSFYASEYSSMIMGIFYGLVFIPMFFFLKHRRSEVDLRFLNVYMYLGFVFGILFSPSEAIGLNELGLWSAIGIPFAIAFNLLCLKILQTSKEV